MGKKRALRFNVGGLDDRSTDVWRLWAQGDDVYIFLRSVSHKMHVSLHKTGVWKIDLDGNRFSLNKEILIADGWGLGPALLFPRLSIKRIEVKGTHLDDKRIEILPSAPMNEMRVIQLCFQRKSEVLSLDKMNSRFMRKNIDWHRVVGLKKMGALHCVSFVEHPTNETIDYFYSIKEKTTIHFKDKIPEKGFLANALMFESPKEKNRQSAIISIPLDIDNCQLEKEKTPNNSIQPTVTASAD